MRHRVRAGVLGRSPSHRLAMYRNLVTSLLEYERIETTDAKAKGVRRIAERMITLGKRGDLHARRRALRVIRSRKVTAKVFDDLAERFRDRPGGYTRIVKVRNRVGDAAPMSIIGLVEGVAAAPAKPEKKKARKAVKAKVRDIIRHGGATPMPVLVKRINATLAGWVNYFRVGNASRAFSEVRDYTEMKVRTLLTRRKRRRKSSIGWRRWSNEYLYGVLGLFWDWKIRPLPGVENMK